MMRVGIIGSGAIGSTIAALMDRAGHRVQVTARGGQLEAIRSAGIRLDGGWGTHLAQVSAATVLTERPELAFVCTKAQDADEAVRSNAEQLAGIPVVVVQNGLTGLDRATSILPGSTCIGALALYASSYTAAGHVTVTTPATTYLGAGDGVPETEIARVTAILNGAMPAAGTTNFVGCQWTKLIVNQINPLPAITGLSVQETISDSLLRLVLTASMREAVRVGFARGIRYGSIQGLTNGILRVVASSPVRIAQALPLLMRQRMGTVPNPGSTLQSIRRGQATEIDFLNGAVVAEAARADLEAPINAEITRMVHGVETSGTFRSPGDVFDAMMRRLHPRP